MSSLVKVSSTQNLLVGFRKIDSACRELLYKAIDALRTKDYIKAQSNIERAIRIQPNDPYLWTQLAYVALKKGDELQASVFSRKAARYGGRK